MHIFSCNQIQCWQSFCLYKLDGIHLQTLPLCVSVRVLLVQPLSNELVNTTICNWLSNAKILNGITTMQLKPQIFPVARRLLCCPIFILV